jgi:hypothetical protein
MMKVAQGLTLSMRGAGRGNGNLQRFRSLTTLEAAQQLAVQDPDRYVNIRVISGFSTAPKPK